MWRPFPCDVRMCVGGKGGAARKMGKDRRFRGQSRGARRTVVFSINMFGIITITKQPATKELKETVFGENMEGGTMG